MLEKEMLQKALYHQKFVRRLSETSYETLLHIITDTFSSFRSVGKFTDAGIAAELSVGSI